MSIAGARQGTIISLRGFFNPSIFQPAWFARQGLIPAEEADAAEVNVIHSQVSAFETTSFRLQVTPETFDLTVAGKPIDQLARDVAFGTFKVLRHTPIGALGINHFRHFEAPSEKAWHSVGDRLAPKDFWQQFMTRPGMQALVIRDVEAEFRRPDGFRGWLDVRIEPSVVVTPHGVFVLVNDHFQTERPDRPESADEMVGALGEAWPAARERANAIIQRVERLVEG
jgi:hypothetical protein